MRPILFEIGNFTFPAYGICFALVLLSVFTQLCYDLRPIGITSQHIISLVCLACSSAVLWLGLQIVGNSIGLGTKFYLSSFPTLAIGAIIYWIYLTSAKLPVGLVFDRIAPLVSVGLGIQYGLGCLLAGSSYGYPTTVPWGVSFSVGSLAHDMYGEERLHPTQVYLGIGFIAVGLLVSHFRSRLVPPGQASLICFMGMGLIYLLVSIWRADLDMLSVDYSVSLSQLVCFIVVMISLIIFYFQALKK